MTCPGLAPRVPEDCFVSATCRADRRPRSPSLDRQPLFALRGTRRSETEASAPRGRTLLMWADFNSPRYATPLTSTAAPRDELSMWPTLPFAARGATKLIRRTTRSAQNQYKSCSSFLSSLFTQNIDPDFIFLLFLSIFIHILPLDHPITPVNDLDHNKDHKDFKILF